MLSFISPVFSIQGEWVEESKEEASGEYRHSTKILPDELNDDEYDTYKTAFATASHEIDNFLNDAYDHIADMHNRQIPSSANAFEILTHNIDTILINLKVKLPFLKTNERISRAFTDMKGRINRASQTLRFHLTMNEIGEDFDMLKFNMDEVFLSLKESAWEYQQL